MTKLTMIKSYKKKSVILGLSMFCSVISIDANAEIFKCINSKFAVFYNDKPCPVTEVERKMKAVKDPVGGYIAPTTFTDEKEMDSRNFVVVGEGNTTVHSNSLNPDSKKENERKQNQGSQAGIGGAKDNSKTNSIASSNTKLRRYKTKDGIMMTKQELQKKHNAY